MSSSLGARARAAHRAPLSARCVSPWLVCSVFCVLFLVPWGTVAGRGLIPNFCPQGCSEVLYDGSQNDGLGARGAPRV